MVAKMTNSEKIKISVITPVYNGEKYLEETILSVLNQSFKSFEYLLIDHASTDSSIEIMKKYADIDSRIKIIRLDINKGGPAYPRNEGLNAARGDYIAFVDADDVWKKNKLQIQLDFLAAHPAIDMVHSLADIIDENSIVQGSFNNQLIKNILRLFMNEKTIIYYTNFININTLILKRDITTKFQEDTTFNAIEDWIFTILAFQSGKKVYLIKEKLISYRIHNTSLSTRSSDLSYRKIFYMYSTLLLDFKIPIIHFIFANSLNTCKLLKRKMGF